MEMNSQKSQYYSHKSEIKKNQKEYNKQFKNKIGKQKRKSWWN